MRKILVATNNVGKLNEFKKILEPKNYEILSLKDLNLDIDVEETGETFEENAYIKAKTISKMTNLITIADDSGLCVNFLNGEPGIYSARYYKGERDSEKNIDFLLENLKGADDRSAYFVSAIVVYKNENTNICSIGKANGKILTKREGSNGFGYDSVFYSYDLKKTFASATQEEKNLVSHRAKALQNLSSMIDEIFD